MYIVPPYEKDIIKEIFRGIDTLLIDFDGTLVHYPQNAKKALMSLLEQSKIPQSCWEEALFKYEQINRDLWTKFEKKGLTINEVRKQRFQELKKYYELIGTPEELDDQYLGYLIDYAVVEQEILHMLNELKKNGLKLYVVTNGIHFVQEGRLEKTGIKNLIDGYITSEKVGIPKPYSKIFKYALKKTKTKPEKALMIGDSYSADIIGASNMSIHSCLIKREETIEWKQEKKPLLIVKDFVEFAQIFLKFRKNSFD